MIIDVKNFGQWREQARALLQRGISPEAIAWQVPEQSSLDFDLQTDIVEGYPILHKSLRIPRRFFELAENVACYREGSRWALLYSVAWRLVFKDKDLLNNSLDNQIRQLQHMAKTVSRAKHKCKAFVRFQKVQASQELSSYPPTRLKNTAPACTDQERYVAWFEPEHLIIPAMAPFFIKRFTQMHWSILTPDICMHWDGETLHFTLGIPNPPKIDDELENLWREYYRSIFNPARLKLKAMQSEMPKKYWKNLPEAELIPELTRNAYQQMQTMIDDGYEQIWEKTAKSSFITHKQNQLREKRKSSQAS